MKKILIILLMISATFIVGCDNNKYQVQRFSFFEAFNTITTIQIVAIEGQFDRTKIQSDVEEILDGLDQLFNVQTSRSESLTALMQINANAGKEAVVVSSEVITVLKEAIEIATLSTVDDVALFDPTIGALWKEWNFVELSYPLTYEIASIPTSEVITAAASLTNYKDIIIDEDASTVYLQTSGMMLDLGGIVKGYAADKIKSYLVDEGITKAVIDVGGNIVLVGSGIDERYNDIPWNVMLRTPYSSQIDSGFDLSTEYYFGSFSVIDKTVVTSGSYERYIKDSDGNNYHHILDPRTGYPFDNDVISVSVVTNLSIKADGLSTMLFAFGLEKGMEYVNSTPDLDAVYVVRENENFAIYVSSGLVDTFNFNQQLEKYNYQYKGEYHE